MTTSYIFLATGFEEIEALTTVDIMRRAGMHVLTVSIEDTPQVAGAHGIPVVADTCISDIDFSQAEWLILPGGMPGATNLAACAPLCDALKAHAAKGGKIAAICASPAVVLAPLGLLAKKDATCYPGFEAVCSTHGAILRDTPVIALPTLVTANGPAASMAFALSIVANTLGAPLAQEIGQGLLFYKKTMNFYFCPSYRQPEQGDEPYLRARRLICFL